MNTQIEIHDNDTVNTGYYKVWYKNNGVKESRLIDESHVNAVLNMSQKEQFFMGKFRFRINEYDFKTIVLMGEKRQGITTLNIY